ncbi:MAG: serine/threonine protein kinase [Chloroflexi bacterium]|nr:serine/threonine protein kinase [Chloroflexota bacterium]
MISVKPPNRARLNNENQISGWNQSGSEGTPTNLIGTILDNYEILAEVASGGMATIYHARQPALDRYVAVKILKAHLAQDARKRERFVREAKVAAQLRHPNILTIHDAKWDPERDIACIIMEYVPGGTLKELMGVPMPIEQIVPLLEQICAALDYAHRNGVVHRDIKPSNILLDKDNRVLIADFGLAAIIGGDTHLSSEGEVLGTPDYMAPEQVDGDPVDARTDVYSLGIMVYEILTGRLPYQAETPMRAMLRRMTESPPSPRVLRPDLSAEIEAVILKAMAQAPSERFPDVQSFWQALKAALQTHLPSLGALRRKTRRMPLQADDLVANNRYKIIKPLGEGAYGVVYLAHDERLERQVALKLLHDKIARTPAEVNRFKREPIITARIGNHPHIVNVYDFEVEDESEGISYIIMEYVDGGSLREYLQEQKILQTLDIAHFGPDICQALEGIHEHQIVHLDLKPGNIMLKTRQRRLTAKVSDFGNAIIRQTEPRDNLENPTPTGSARGTLLYTSPEQIAYKRGDDLDGRADLYSLGAILYEMVAGRPPFELEGVTSLIHRITEDPPPPPTAYNPFIC